MDTMTKADPQALAEAMLRQAQLDWEASREEADEKRRRAVLSARAAGWTDQQIADAMGLSRPRVQQIKADTP